MAKKILKIVSILLLIASLVLAIVTLINYYTFIDCINTLKDTSLNPLEIINLHEKRELFMLRTLSTMLWTLYIAIISCIVNIANFFISKKTREPKKIR